VSEEKTVVAVNARISKPNCSGLQDPSEINGDNLNNIRREASRHFRNRKREYLKDKIDELVTNTMIKKIRAV
jgi:hypothetical protein